MTTEHFIAALWALMIDLKPLDKSVDQGYVLVFSAGCAVIGFLIVILDLCSQVTSSKSVFGLSHGLLKTPILIVFWPLGAAITGYIGSIFQVFQPGLLACVTAGVAWHFTIRQIANKTRQPVEEEDDTPEDAES